MLRLIPAPVHRASLRTAYWLRHMFRKSFRPRLRGVSIVGSNREGHALLVRHSYGSDAWSLPGGGCGRREEPEAAARREMREELGVEIHEVELLTMFEETISGAPHSAYIYAAVVEHDPNPDRREILEARFFPPNALPDRISPLAATRIAIWQQASGMR